THRPPDTRACDVGAAGPAEGNRKHHPKVAPPVIPSLLAVRVFSQPQKMVFDCDVYGRHEGGCDKPNHRQKATARHYTTPFPKCDLAYLCRRQWHAGCVYEQQAIVSRSSGTGRTQNRGRSTPMAS